MKPSSVPRIVDAKFHGDYVVELIFKDRERRIVDLKPFLRGRIFEPLLDLDLFHEMFIEEGGGLAWPSGADICPNLLYYNLPPASVEV